MSEFAKIYVALGGNLPCEGRSPQETLAEALQQLPAAGAMPVRVSSFWTSLAWPDPSKPAYVNALAEINTDLSPVELLGVLQATEESFGRERHHRWDSRTLDLDLIDYREKVSDSADLTLPHPRTHERAFVLLPLAEIAPNWVHPVSKKTITDLISALPADLKAHTRRLN